MSTRQSLQQSVHGMLDCAKCHCGITRLSARQGPEGQLRQLPFPGQGRRSQGKGPGIQAERARPGAAGGKRRGARLPDLPRFACHLPQHRRAVPHEPAEGTGALLAVPSQAVRGLQQEHSRQGVPREEKSGRSRPASTAIWNTAFPRTSEEQWKLCADQAVRRTAMPSR